MQILDRFRLDGRVAVVNLADLIDRRIVLGRTGDVDEFSAAVVFLASDPSSYVTGAVLAVDGGFLLT